MTIVAAIAYLFTPLTAAGPEGHPLAFGINLRYLTPGLALGLALVPLEPRLVPGRLRLPLLVGGLIALFLTSRYSDANVAWEGAFASIPWAALMGIVFVAIPVGLALLARRRAMLAGLAGAVLALAIAAVGWERQDDYFAHRYSRAEDFRFQLDDAVRWAKPTSDLRIAVAGTSGAYNQYGFYGDDVSQLRPVRRPPSAGGGLPRDRALPRVPPGGQRRGLRLPGHHTRARPEQPLDSGDLAGEGLGDRTIRPSRRSSTRAASRSSGSTAPSTRRAAARGPNRRRAGSQPGGSTTSKQ